MQRKMYLSNELSRSSLNRTCGSHFQAFCSTATWWLNYSNLVHREPTHVSQILEREFQPIDSVHVLQNSVSTVHHHRCEYRRESFSGSPVIIGPAHWSFMHSTAVTLCKFHDHTPRYSGINVYARLSSRPM